MRASHVVRDRPKRLGQHVSPVVMRETAEGTHTSSYIRLHLAGRVGTQTLDVHTVHTVCVMDCYFFFGGGDDQLLQEKRGRHITIYFTFSPQLIRIHLLRREK